MVKLLKLKNTSGLTLQEVLIVLTIIAFLIALSGLYFHQLRKAHDGKRKSDMEMIKVAFEEYFNDYHCYPLDVSMFGNQAKCGNEQEYPDGFQPWLKRIPCDSGGKPYKVVVESSPCPSWFIIYTSMEDLQDPQVVNNECYRGCTVENMAYNYAVTSDNTSVTRVARCSGLCFIRRKEDGSFGPCNGPRGPSQPCPDNPGDRCFRDSTCNSVCEVKSCLCQGVDPGSPCTYEAL